MGDLESVGIELIYIYIVPMSCLDRYQLIGTNKQSNIFTNKQCRHQRGFLAANDWYSMVKIPVQNDQMTKYRFSSALVLLVYLMIPTRKPLGTFKIEIVLVRFISTAGWIKCNKYICFKTRYLNASIIKLNWCNTTEHGTNDWNSFRKIKVLEGFQKWHNEKN